MFLILSVIIHTGILFVTGYLNYKSYLIGRLQENEIYPPLLTASSKEKKNEKQNIHEKLLALLEDETVFTMKGLKIKDIARMLCSNRTYISNVINDEFNMTFTDFINDYRLEYAKKIISQSKYRDLSLSEVGIMSGFSSDSSFYRIFKQKEGITPLEYKRKYYRERGDGFGSIS